jgi:heme exporter protein B
MTAFAAILRKDLTIELRARESVPAMVLFSVCVFVLFHFGVARNSLGGADAAGVLWVTLLLATVLGVSRLFASEIEQDGFDAARLAGVGGISMLAAKAVALFVFLLCVELVAVPSFAILLLAPSVFNALPVLVCILVLSAVGFAIVGALVSALAAEAKARELLVPLMLLPLLVPILIASAAATKPLFELSQAPAGLAKWLALLGVYDIVFVLISIAVFDFLMED